MLSLTIVIPVFNEEHHIKDCLDSIAGQSQQPDEVVIIDNNCTDRTIEIAEKYEFVRIVNETRQGRGYARTAGFNAAKTDIIARIDADSRLQEDWIANVKRHLSNDDSLYGITGIGNTTFFPGVSSVRTTIFSRAYYWFVHAGFRTITMWGATMAIRTEAWNAVKDKVCLDDSIVHEDQDVSLWIAAEGMKIEQKNDLLITTSGQTYRYLPKLVHYSRLFWSTKRLHTKNGNLAKSRKLSYPSLLPGMVGATLMSVVLAFGAVVFFPLDYGMIHRGNRKKWLE